MDPSVILYLGIEDLLEIFSMKGGFTPEKGVVNVEWVDCHAGFSSL